MAKSNLQWVPVGPGGGLLNYTSKSYPETSGRDFGVVAWRKAEDFYAVLQFQGVHREGRSAVVARWKDVCTDQTYTMFLSELSRVIAGCQFQGVGIVDGKWRFHKRGANYGIGPVLDGEE